MDVIENRQIDYMKKMVELEAKLSQMAAKLKSLVDLPPAIKLDDVSYSLIDVRKFSFLRNLFLTWTVILIIILIFSVFQSKQYLFWNPSQETTEAGDGLEVLTGKQNAVDAAEIAFILKKQGFKKLFRVVVGGVLTDDQLSRYYAKGKNCDAVISADQIILLKHFCITLWNDSMYQSDVDGCNKNAVITKGQYKERMTELNSTLLKICNEKRK